MSKSTARVLASGRYIGRVGTTEFRGKNGFWTDVWADLNTPPFACRVFMIRDGMRPQVFVGLWHEHAKDNAFFRRSPCEAIERCVVAKAIRMLFADVIGRSPERSAGER